MLLFVASATAQSELDYSPTSWTQLNVNSGDSFTKQIDVTWNGDNTVLLEAETQVEGNQTNSNGINVTHTPNYFVLDPTESQTIDVRVDTAYGLKPDTFKFLTNIKFVEERDTGGSGGGGGGGIPEDDYEEVQNELNETRDLLEDQNATTEELREQTQNLIDQVENLTDTNEEYRNQTQGLMETINNYEDRVEELEANNTELQDELEQERNQTNQSEQETAEGDIVKSLNNSLNPETPLNPPVIIIQTILNYFGWL